MKMEQAALDNNLRVGIMCNAKQNVTFQFSPEIYYEELATRVTKKHTDFID